MLRKKIKQGWDYIFRKIPITLKVTLWYTTFIIILMGSLIFGSFYAVDQVADRVSKRDLVEEVNKAANGRGRFSSFEDGVYLALYDSNNNLIGGALPNDFQGNSSTTNIINEYSNGDNNYYYYNVELTSNNINGAKYLRGVAAVSNISRELLIIPIGLLIISPFIILLITYIGYRIIRSAFKPVRVMTETAQSIAEHGNISERINLPTGKDEIHNLGMVLNNMLATLEKSYNREKRFSADVSHELRTPVSVISAESDYSLNYVDNIEEAKQSFEVIVRQSKRMTHMINQILEISRLDQLEKIETEYVNLSKILKIVLSDYKKLIEQNNIVVATKIEEDIHIFANVSLLQRAIDNLVLNAIKFTKSEIVIVLKEEADSVTFEILDDGEGIPKNEKEHIWQRFYKVDKSRTNTDNKSTGLGLAITKKIVELHSAYIGVEDNISGGSKFIIKFKK